MLLRQRNNVKPRILFVMMAGMLSCAEVCGLAQAVPDAKPPAAKAAEPEKSVKPTKPAAGNPSGPNPAQMPTMKASPSKAITPSSAASSEVAPAASVPDVTTTNPLKITLTASETPLKIGSTSNIAATIQNMSSKAVLVDLESVQLATHGIVATTTSNCVVAIRANYNESQGTDVLLQPQDQVSVMFNLAHGYIASDPAKEDLTASGNMVPAPNRNGRAFKQSMQCDPSVWGTIKRALDFSPGNYDYFVSGYFSQGVAPAAGKTGAGDLSMRKRPFSFSANFAVGIDQTTIIIFAVIGGWLALLVVTFNESKKVGSIMHDFASFATQSEGWKGFVERVTSSQGVRAALKFFFRACGAAILSASFTIVSSRLSDTQLPVKITILDAWGAMTVGFVSFFIGQKFIAALAGWGSSTPKPSNHEDGAR